MKAFRWVQPAIAAFFVSVFLVAGMGAASAANKVDALAAALLADPSFKVRTQAALLLGKLGDKDAIDSLVKALGDDNKTVRAMAAQSLGKLGGDKATVALKSLLQRESGRITGRQRSKGLLEVWSVYRRKQSGGCQSAGNAQGGSPPVAGEAAADRCGRKRGREKPRQERQAGLPH
jgi:hypothetical protein